MFGQPVTLTSSSSAGASSFATGTAGRSDVVASLDWMKSGPIVIQSVVTTSGGGGLTYNVEYTMDAITPSASNLGSSQMNWFSSGSSAQSSNCYVTWNFPVRAVRVNATAATSNQSVTLTIAQSAL